MSCCCRSRSPSITKRFFRRPSLVTINYCCFFSSTASFCLTITSTSYCFVYSFLRARSSSIASMNSFFFSSLLSCNSSFSFSSLYNTCFSFFVSFV